jgi:uncharacterized integral membrane protein
MQPKLILVLGLIILLIIFVSQNTGIAQLKFLFWTFEMSVIILISLILLVGIILGFIISKVFDRPVIKENIPKETDPKEKDRN